MRPLALAALLISALLAAAQDAATPVTIRVDANARLAPMTAMWAMFGYDEPNYTYTANGKKLLGELAELSPVPVYVRAPNQMTNAYTEDAEGRPRYDWTIVDRIFDTYVERKMKPLVEIGFMPEALSTHPQPYKHDWKPGTNAPLYTGWSYPPKDYSRWRDIVSEWARHSLQRYGRSEVESWST